MVLPIKQKGFIMKFIKGFTYLVRVQQTWYIVQQTGMKTWYATRFSHVTNKADPSVIESGNGQMLADILRRRAGDTFKVRQYNTHYTLREAMFNILKTGDIDG